VHGLHGGIELGLKLAWHTVALPNAHKVVDGTVLNLEIAMLGEEGGNCSVGFAPAA
jgi:hypothetical protein